MDKFLELEEKLKTEKNSFEKFKLFDESVKFGEKAKTGLGLFIEKKLSKGTVDLFLFRIITRKVQFLLLC